MARLLDHGWSLVLSGGGARGAYEAGAVRYLAENVDRFGIEPVAFAGASIGALNGAVLAASPTLKDGSARLLRVWQDLDQDRILAFQTSQGSLGRQLAIAAAMLTPLVGAAALSAVSGGLMSMGASGLIEEGVLSDGYLKGLLERETTSDEGITRPLWISAYRTQGALIDLARVMVAELGGPDTPSSEYLLLQDIEPTKRLQALLASAALPVAYGKQRLQGTHYRDGGLGDWRTSDGNTPLRPLANLGCKRAIVIHLADGSLWDRHSFEETAVIEIRPKEPIHPEGGLPSLVNFHPSRIEAWIYQGYEDARRCVGPALQALSSRQAAVAGHREAHEALTTLAADDLSAMLRSLETP